MDLEGLGRGNEYDKITLHKILNELVKTFVNIRTVYKQIYQVQMLACGNKIGALHD